MLLAPRAQVPPPLLFRGWLVVAGAFLVLMVGFGAAYSYAAFADEIGAAFGSSRATVSLVYALCGGTCFFASAVTPARRPGRAVGARRDGHGRGRP